jgi:hypothetical protein
MMLACLLLLAAPAELEDLRADLDAAKREYSEKQEKTHQQLLNGFDNAIKEVARTGNLDLVKTLNKEKQDYEAYYTLPVTRQMGRAKAEYENAVRAARIELTAAYEKAKAEYTKKLDLKNAEIVDQELKDFLDREKNKNLNDSLVTAGSEWSGFNRVTSARGVTKTDFTMVVIKRDGEEIEYQMWQENHSRGLLFRGTLSGGVLKSRCVEFLKGKFSPDTLGAPNTGKFMGKRFVFEAYDKGSKTYSILELLLVEPK